MMVAVTDGFAVQKLLDPDAVRLDVVLPFRESVLHLVVRRPCRVAAERPARRTGLDSVG
jgi:hypothetical protein